MINPTFRQVWYSDKPNIVMKGGRSSMKSSVASLKLVYDFLVDPNANIVVFRKVASSLAMSVYEQIKWAIGMYGLENDFRYFKAPAKIVHKKTGTAFYFSGADSTEKLKGMNIAHGYISRIWFEEITEFTPEDLIQIKVTLTRQKLPDGRQVVTYYTFNPPKDKYNLINEWVDSVVDESDFLVHHSSYLDDDLGFLSQQVLDEIERYKVNDYEYYRWLFLGQVVGLGGNIYNADLIRVRKTFEEDERLLRIYYSVDSGYQVSATVFLCCGITNKGNLWVLNTYYYDPSKESVKKAPSEFSVELNEFISKTSREWQVPIAARYIDSAEGALRNQYFKDFHQRLSPVKKAKKVHMIERMTSLLSRGSFYILDKPENEMVLKEHQQYSWNEETLKTDNPQPNKVFDHSCDAVMYVVFNSARDFGLKY